MLKAGEGGLAGAILVPHEAPDNQPAPAALKSAQRNSPRLLVGRGGRDGAVPS